MNFKINKYANFKKKTDVEISFTLTFNKNEIDVLNNVLCGCTVLTINECLIDCMPWSQSNLIYFVNWSNGKNEQYRIKRIELPIGLFEADKSYLSNVKSFKFKNESDIQKFEKSLKETLIHFNEILHNEILLYKLRSIR